MMTTNERLLALQRWVYENVCVGRTLKTRGPDDKTSVYAEPRCFIAFYPMRSLQGQVEYSIAPSITMVPGLSRTKQVQEQRFDRYNGIHRTPDMGATLNVQFVFTVYDPGLIDGDVQAYDPENEGTPPPDDGFTALTTWMDDLQRKLLGVTQLPGTDLFVWNQSMDWAPLTEQESVRDMRPLYYGMVNCEFGCYANKSPNEELERILNG